jgi:phosphate acetyltransferase
MDCKLVSFEDAVFKFTKYEYANLYRSAMLLSLGYVDGSIAGSMSPTAEVLRTSIYCIGLEQGFSKISSFFMMKKKDIQYAFADCGVIQNPSSSELSEIAILTALNYFKLTGLKPVIGFISHSTNNSAKGDDVDKVRKAIEISTLKRPDLDMCPVEIQMDVALNSEIGLKKKIDRKYAGKINVFIFPDLDAGNIAYKTFQEVGGYNAVGPIVQGLKKPMMDLSRGCKVEDIVDLAKMVVKLLETKYE